jgi:hypothetical protein
MLCRPGSESSWYIRLDGPEKLLGFIVLVYNEKMFKVHTYILGTC